MSYRRRQGLGAQLRKPIRRGEFAKLQARSLNLYERSRLRKTRRRLTLLLVMTMLAGMAGWLVAGRLG